jgi:hypothetical protein
MTNTRSYAIVPLNDGRLRLDRTSEPGSCQVAYIKPVTGRRNGLDGWQLQPIVVVQGSRSKIWPTAVEAIASTKLLTASAARRLLENARLGPCAGGTR